MDLKWKFRMRIGQILICLLLAVVSLGVKSARYRELRHVIDLNTGFAHMTRGVNMFTLYALRSCVGEGDIPVLRDMLRDKDIIIRMAVSAVLVDMGSEGKQVVQSRLAEVKDSSEKSMLQESLNNVANPGYRPVLQYPLSAAERARIRGCR